MGEPLVRRVEDVSSSIQVVSCVNVGTGYQPSGYLWHAWGVCETDHCHEGGRLARTTWWTINIDETPSCRGACPALAKLIIEEARALGFELDQDETEP